MMYVIDVNKIIKNVSSVIIGVKNSVDIIVYNNI